jgi:hypothetical protein
VLFDDECDCRRLVDAAAWVDGLGWDPHQRGDTRSTFVATRRTPVDGSPAGGDSVGIWAASAVAALPALCLRQYVIDGVGEGHTS